MTILQDILTMEERTRVTKKIARNLALFEVMEVVVVVVVVVVVFVNSRESP